MLESRKGGLVLKVAERSLALVFFLWAVQKTVQESV